MGLFSMLRGQCIDVIEWTDNTGRTIVHKYDMGGKEIMMGAQLTVRESQVAIFVNEGQLADIFKPGRYELHTSNLPIMTKLQAWQFGFNSPFKSDVYFISTKQFLDCKWGTANPVMMRDSELGMIRLRAFGTYAFRVADPETLMREVFGTAALYTVDDVEGQLKRMLVSGFSDAVASANIPALDLATHYDELGEQAVEVLGPRVAKLGLELTSFVVENISLPEEVGQAIDRRTSMGVAGDLDQYTKYQAAEAIRDAAKNQSGMAGAGIGMAAGAAMGQVLQQSAAQPAAAGAVCTACGAKMSAGARFCPACGAKQESASQHFCPTCGKPVNAGAHFCAACGAKLD